jgi:hypothetical protein
MRVGAAWKNKRVKALTGLPMTARCPAWLRLSADRLSYELIPERVEIVREIFADSIAGMGTYATAARLNRAGVPAFEGGKGWHRSYVAKILQNRAVLGEFQPHVKADGKRIPDGDPIPGYYPTIITDEMFHQVKYARSQRKVGGAGRKGPGFTNLFSGLAHCAYCGSSIAFENKGDGKRGGTYLVCSDAQRGRGCIGTRWRYTDFEASFLAFVQELDLESIIDADDDAAKRQELERELSAIRGELVSVNDLMEKTYATLNAGGPPEFIAGKLNELVSRKEELSRRLTEREAEQNEFNARDSRFYTSKEEIRGLVGKLQMPPSDELYKLRARIASRLKVLVETLLVAPQGATPVMQKSIDQLREISTSEDDEVIAHMEQMAAHPDQSRRYFAVGFRDAAVRAVYPSYGDPLQYEQQVVADGSSIEMVLSPR